MFSPEGGELLRLLLAWPMTMRFPPGIIETGTMVNSFVTDFWRRIAVE
ncbi:hypothetical protein N9985_01125 [Gammaproteobacteria bacterium]|nr:hypothetical protein [Gammaproteobacteria bacterium]